MKKLFVVLKSSFFLLSLLVACTLQGTPEPPSRPTVKIMSPLANSEFQCDKLKLSVSAIDSEPLERIEVYVDGDPTYTQSINNAYEYNGEFLIEIENCQPGNHLIEVMAVNYNGRSSIKQMLQVMAQPEITATQEIPSELTPDPEIILRPIFTESGIVFLGNDNTVEAQENKRSTWPFIGKTDASVMARGLLSFDISQIKPDTQITSALLRLDLSRFGAGLPPETTFAIDAVNYGFTVTPNAYNIGPYLTPYESGEPISSEIDLIDEVQYAINNKLTRLQLRLYFTNVPNGSNQPGYGFVVDMTKTKLVIQRNFP
jgi:hypothetical protein